MNPMYNKHVDISGKHHNPFSPAGFPALQKAMAENHLEFPDKQLTVKNVLGDGDPVAVHSRIVMRPGGNSVAAVHIFRFERERIVDLWDCGQPEPVDSPNIVSKLVFQHLRQGARELRGQSHRLGGYDALRSGDVSTDGKLLANRDDSHG